MATGNPSTHLWLKLGLILIPTIVLVLIIWFSQEYTELLTPTPTIMRVTVSNSPTRTSTNTNTPSPTATYTLTPTPTNTPTQTPTFTPTPYLAVVTAETLVLRTGPAISHPEITRLREGDTLVALGRNLGSQWLFVSTTNGNLGWVFIFGVEIGFDVELLPIIDPKITPSLTSVPTSTSQVIEGTDTPSLEDD